MSHAASHDLLALAEELLAEARSASSGRASRTLLGERGQVLHQTLIALLAGQGLAEHGNPGQASLPVLSGALTLTSGDLAAPAGAGTLLEVPPAVHAVTAESDVVFLLTVARVEA